MSSMVGNQGMRGPAGSSAGQSMTGGNIIPKGHKLGQIQQFTPEQMQLFKQMFSQVGPGSFLSRLAGGDQSMFEEMEAPAMKQFGQLQSQLGSQFTQLAPGAMSAQRGSGFRNTANQQTADFAQALQGQRMGLQKQAIQDLMGLQGSLLGQRPYDRQLIEKQQKQGGWGGLIGAGLGGLAGSFIPGIGTLAGATLGQKLGSAF